MLFDLSARTGPINVPPNFCTTRPTLTFYSYRIGDIPQRPSNPFATRLQTSGMQASGAEPRTLVRGSGIIKAVVVLISTPGLLELLSHGYRFILSYEGLYESVRSSTTSATHATIKEANLKL